MRSLRLLVLVALAPLAVACGGSPDASTSTSSASASTTDPVQPSNFLQVTDGIYRGGHPDTAGVAYLKSIGIKTVIDLEIADFVEAFPWEIAQEEHDEAQAGLKLLRYPMSAFEPAASDDFDARIEDIIASLRDDSLKPIYVHCKHGQDRTGLVIGLERVIIEGWDPQTAHDEMVSIGFHVGFLGLEDYYERKTGWSPPSN